MDVSDGVEVARQERSFDRLQRMGIVAWEQVLLTLPTSYKDYTVINPFLPSNEALYPVGKACYAVQVASHPNLAGKAPPRLSFNVTDGCCTAKLTVFGNVWAWEHLQIGDDIIVEAVVDVWEGNLQLNSPSYIRSAMAGKLIPVYRGKRGANKAATISPEFIYDKTREALTTQLDATSGFIVGHFQGMDEKALVRRSGIPFPDLKSMLLAIHAPSLVEDGVKGLEAARSIAAFEVIFNAERQAARKPNPKSVINIKQADVEALIAKLPFKFTEHQDTGVREIVQELRSPYQMNRLLSGDVGFGKTDVALIPAIAANMAGAKIVIMCPSLLIVNQWAEKIQGFGKSTNCKIVASGAKLDKKMLAENPILVGTTALVTRLPKLKFVPDFVIFDEQQKHGKGQKESLVGSHTNRLDATATCQPKTAALVNYGGMSETILNQCPVVKKITSRIVMPEERARLFAHIQKILAEVKDSQFAVVYPNVSTGEGRGSLLSAAEMWEQKFPGMTGILHGKMSDTDKAKVMAKMHRGEIRILLSSILIETGITLPSLRGLIVVGADRFGVSALHQLRGRLARHGGQGYFYMYLQSADVQPETMERLDLLVKYSDGFVLAEKDAEMRGYGSMDDDDESQSGVSRSAMFFGLRLMPKDIERAMSAV